MSYWDSKEKRLLMRDGKSVVDPYTFAEMMWEGKDTSKFHMMETESSLYYDLRNNTHKSVDIDQNPAISGVVRFHTEEDIEELLDRIYSSSRLKGTEEEDKRIEMEVDYFIRSGNILFVLWTSDTINKFKEDGVIWGVGRGSSCASYVLYLLDVHCVDSIAYDIPFRELSKED